MEQGTIWEPLNGMALLPFTDLPLEGYADLTRERIDLGKLGEDLALKKIRHLGYQCVTRNYRCPLGEIDLIAKDGGCLVFIEIKARTSSGFGLPQEAVDGFKQRRLVQVAKAYVAERNVKEAIISRFDVVAVQLTPSGPKIELIKDAFHLDEHGLAPRLFV